MELVRLDSEGEYKSGFAGLIGRPNVGKSTLLNRLARKKLAITSDKPQTTRNRIQAVITTDDSQLVFVDTPGFHKPRDALGERLNSLVLATMKDVDVIVFVLDGDKTIGRGDIYIAGELERVETPVVGVLNKTDLMDHVKIESQMEVARHLYSFAHVIGVSSKFGAGVDELERTLMGFLKPGPQYFPSNMVSDQPERVLVAELIREKALELTRDEVPHSVAVLIEDIRQREDKDIIDIEAIIYVERESQKGIVVGKGGRMVKEIGTRARREIEPILGNKVYLDIRVKVEKDWSKNPEFIKRLDYQ